MICQISTIQTVQVPSFISTLEMLPTDCFFFLWLVLCLICLMFPSHRFGFIRLVSFNLCALYYLGVKSTSYNPYDATLLFSEANGAMSVCVGQELGAPGRGSFPRTLLMYILSPKRLLKSFASMTWVMYLCCFYTLSLSFILHFWRAIFVYLRCI